MPASNREIVSDLIDKVPKGVSVGTYVVSLVRPAAARDGHDQVSIKVGAQNLPAPYLDSYLDPALGDEVTVLMNSGSPTILGRLAGLPNL